MKNILIILFVISFFEGLAQPLVDGFNKGKGNLDLVGSYTYDSFSKFYAAPGLISLKRKTNVFSFYSAYGITDKWTIQVSLPFISSGDQAGIQDLAIVSKVEFLSRKMGKGNFSMLVSNGITTPLSNYETETLFALGQKAMALDSRIIAQFFMNNGLFFMAQSGYTYRLNPVPSSLPIALKIGLAKEKNYFDIWADYQNGAEGYSYRDGFGTSFRKFTVSFIRIGGTYYRSLSTKLGLAFNVSNTLKGENVGASTNGSIALIVKFKKI